MHGMIKSAKDRWNVKLTCNQIILFLVNKTSSSDYSVNMKCV